MEILFWVSKIFWSKGPSSNKTKQDLEEAKTETSVEESISSESSSDTIEMISSSTKVDKYVEETMSSPGYKSHLRSMNEYYKSLEEDLEEKKRSRSEEQSTESPDLSLSTEDSLKLSLDRYQTAKDLCHSLPNMVCEEEIMPKMKITKKCKKIMQSSPTITNPRWKN